MPSGPTLLGVEFDRGMGPSFLGLEFDGAAMGPVLCGVEVEMFPPYHGNNVVFDRGSKWKAFSAGVKRKVYFQG